jgi:hypothetical protein
MTESELNELAELLRELEETLARLIFRGSREKQKARETLATLLNLWKDADPNLPLLKQAKAEYAKQ